MSYVLKDISNSYIIYERTWENKIRITQTSDKNKAKIFFTKRLADSFIWEYDRTLVTEYIKDEELPLSDNPKSDLKISIDFVNSLVKLLPKELKSV
jgi:hypothetical protein